MSVLKKSGAAAMIGSIALTLGAFGVQPSYAGSGRNCMVGNCPDYIARRMCNSALNAKGLKGPARTAEFDKCKLDPINYK